MVEKKNFLTEAGYKKLKEELDYLKKVKRTDVAGKIKEAREMGDVLENTVYDAALEEQGYIEGRIQEIEDLLAKAEIISEKSKGSLVNIGSTVIVEVDGKEDEFTIVGSVEADPMSRKISHESPVGQALVGAKKGDIIEVKTPIITAVYKILDVK